MHILFKILLLAGLLLNFSDFPAWAQPAQPTQAVPSTVSVSSAPSVEQKVIKAIEVKAALDKLSAEVDAAVSA